MWQIIIILSDFVSKPHWKFQYFEQAYATLTVNLLISKTILRETEKCNALTIRRIKFTQMTRSAFL